MCAFISPICTLGNGVSELRHGEVLCGGSDSDHRVECLCSDILLSGLPPQLHLLACCS